MNAMHDVSVALFWHQHQPYYPDDVGGENPMPWVRFHGIKDYWGMAMLLSEVPEMKATVNLVPSLLAQLAAYTDQGHTDTPLRISRLPTDSLAESDVHFLLDNCFMVHPDHMIRPHPRYWELYQKRGLSVDPAARAAKRFATRDLIDLVCWNNLAWFHPVAFEKDRDLSAFRAKGRGWTEAEKQWLLDKQLDILGQIVPLHRRLAEAGQIELTTTPYYHPILPLLFDKRLARQAMPDVQLPRHLESYPEDAAEHVRRGVAYHTQVFGQPPKGMWPSEGSVCHGLVGMLAAAGLEWIATDEEILSASTEGWVARDANGFLRNPEMLYRPWRIEERGRQLSIIFRDHAMSDQIGFQYQRYQPDHAVGDFIGKLEAIGKATQANAAQRSSLVSIILDGENCWEYYPNGGVDFLRLLYRTIAAHPKISAVRVSDYLARHPATDKLGHLFPGSWIGHNFGIWIGHPECNRAWDLLHQTREFLRGVQGRLDVQPEPLARAWEELYIAQGSDWFWWFGDSHTSAQDDVFDRLFRKHLQNVYLLLGEQAPSELARPISQGHRHQRAHTEPTSLLNVKIDGRQTYFEWINAGTYTCTGSRGTMSMVQEGRLVGLHFGFDSERLLLRFDARGGSTRERLADVESLRVRFLEPEGFEAVVLHPDWQEPIAELYHHEVPISRAGVRAAGDKILELAIPYRSLGISTDAAVHFVVELESDEQSLERLPHEGAIETTVPSPDFELIMWQA